MSSESPQPSIQPRSPIDPSIVRVLRSLDPIARAVDCSYFLAGATARDLVLVNVYGLRPGRATRDIDFGIAVESWERFAMLKESLVATGEFTSDQHALQRLMYSDPATGFSQPVDLNPFRGVSSSEGMIEWPPSRDIVMNMAGFEEALASSILVNVDDNLTVRVASIPGLMLLKLVAWSERGEETNKDASDIYRLLNAYADSGNTDRLYDDEMDLLQTVGFDMEVAGAELLGRDVARLCSEPLLGFVQSLLSSDVIFERLVNQVVRITTIEEASPFAERILTSFRNGFLANG